MFKIFNFLKYVLLIAGLGILAVFSSVSFGDNIIEKDRFKSNAFWQIAGSVVGTLVSTATNLGRANLENKIPFISEVDFEEIPESLEEGNTAWSDFFANIKEEWSKTKLE